MNRQRFVVFGCEHDGSPAVILDVDVHPAVVVCQVPPRPSEFSGWAATLKRAEDLCALLNREQQVTEVFQEAQSKGVKP
jgi:hypothetical protein